MIGPTNFNVIFSYLDEIADLLGLNNWDLQQGQYNGVTFHAITQFPINQFNPFNSLIQNFNSYNSSNSLDPNAAPPYGSGTVSNQVIDQFRKNIVQHNIPNYQGAVLEDLGAGSFKFSINIVVYGTAYFQMLQNMILWFADPNGTLSGSSYRILVHPIFGKIPQVYFNSMQIKHESAKWKACVAQLNFTLGNISNLIGTAITQQALSPSLSNFSTYLNEAQNIAAALGITLSDAAAIRNLFL